MKKEKSTGAEVPQVAVLNPETAPEQAAATETPPTLKDVLIGIGTKYRRSDGKCNWRRAFKENPGWAAILGGTSKEVQVRHTAALRELCPQVPDSAEDKELQEAALSYLGAVRKHPGRRILRSEAPALAQYMAKHGRDGYHRARDLALQIGKASSITAIREQKGSGVPYTDGAPYCPHCGMFNQPWNRAYNASRNAGQVPAASEAPEIKEDACSRN